jgi:hypothetical protein
MPCRDSTRGRKQATSLSISSSVSTCCMASSRVGIMCLFCAAQGERSWERCAVCCIPVRFCPSSPRPPAPTKGAGGGWAS